MRILLTGKDGQLGQELHQALDGLGQVLAVGRGECDLRSPVHIRQVVAQAAPDLIVNPAAYTAVDDAEENAEVAHAVNATAPAVLAEEAERRGIPLIHFSTDYVFDGKKSGPYDEADAPNPLNVYGQSKLRGEEGVRAKTDNYYIFRTSWVFGRYRSNFLKTILRLAAERDVLRVVSDQMGAPTSAGLLADMTASVIRRHAQAAPEKPAPGIYHLTASGQTSWYDYACLVVREAAARGQNLRLRWEDIQPQQAADYPVKALRPMNSRLSTARFEQQMGVTLPSWQDGVSGVLTQILAVRN